jgi:aspartokinase/homoserine dehydrogenase 1
VKILKFGGSSLAKPERVESVCRIVARAAGEGQIAVVVSAFGGVTDSLLGTTGAAARREDSYLPRIEGLERRHRVAVEALAPEAERAALDAFVGEIFAGVRDLVHGVYLLREASARTLDAVASAGERLSAAIVAAALRRDGLDAEACDARKLIVTGPEFGGARVREPETHARVRAHFATPRPLQVVTGFIASTEDDETTTLGRGGSDYTASILGAALGAEAIELWTDVDGVLSADPRLVPDAVPTARLSYDELMELSHFGAKVVHPPSVHPARRHGIPLWIKNTFRPEVPGTLVADGVAAADGHAVRGVASIGRVTLLRLAGDGMVGVPGIAMRLFGALARQSVNVIMISQASSEHSICFAVRPEDAARAARSIAEEFAVERQAGLVDELVVEEDQSVVAAVGSGMRERCGVAASLFGVLGRHGVNVRAIAQGSSELNISLVVDARNESRAVNAIHDAFFVGGSRRVEIAVAGVGRVGGEVLRQVAERVRPLEAARGIRLRLVGVADSKGALLDPEGIDPAGAVERARAAERQPFAALVERLEVDRGATRILVDCTAGLDVPASYERLLRSGASIVTANKLPFAGSLVAHKALLAAGPGRIFRETTVGAALPVLGTLEGLLAAGDRVRRISGVLSGTLGFLLEALSAGRAFRDAVRDAHERGYTEPDPREDLGGRDVARKLLILARIAGYALEPEDVAVSPLFPAEWNALPLEEFWARLAQLDGPMEARVAEAGRNGRRLVYLAELRDGEARVGLEEVDPEHPGARVRGTDNLIAFGTDRYRESPLVVAGPGAGPELTASGVLADVLRAIEPGGAS